MMILKRIYNFLSSYKLAMTLLVTILASCVFGVTILRGEEAWNMIFSTLWFNAILILLMVNVACCFFGRIWGRRVTVISFGMILFHLSFVAIMAGIIYNSLFYFKGEIRLTEGETLLSGDLRSYDKAYKGRLFDFSRLKGETSLIKMHRNYKVNGKDKMFAYEISVGERGSKKEGIIYATKNLKYNGFRFFTEKEGYSIQTHLYDRKGKEIFAAHIPLQSLLRDDESMGTDDKSYFYTTGTKEGPGSLPFPQDRVRPLFYLQAAYIPDPIKERAGEVFFQVWPLQRTDEEEEVVPVAEGKAAVGEKFDAGEYHLSVQEIRYWAAMTVRYDPGLPVVLTFLWVSLGGMVITFFGRMRRGM